jgi:hypothetical protein
MRIFEEFFALACKKSKDGAIAIGILLASNSRIDRILAEAAERVVLEVGRRRSVFRVLKATDDPCASFALRSSTGKDVTRSAFKILIGNVGFEE